MTHGTVACAPATPEKGSERAHAGGPSADFDATGNAVAGGAPTREDSAGRPATDDEPVGGTPADADPPEAERPRLQLTPAQIGAGVAAAITSAILGSGLGLAGTVVGAGLGSAVSITASAVYSHSIATTRHRLNRTKDRFGAAGRALGTAARLRPIPLAGPPAPAGGNGCAHAQHAGMGVLLARTEQGINGTGDSRPSRRPSRTPRQRETGVSRWRTALLGAAASAAIFALALFVITGIESVKGAPLAGGTPGGLSVLGGGSIGWPDRAEPAGPTDSPDASSADGTGSGAGATGATGASSAPVATDLTGSTSSGAGHGGMPDPDPGATDPGVTDHQTATVPGTAATTTVPSAPDSSSAGNTAGAGPGEAPGTSAATAAPSASQSVGTAGATSGGGPSTLQVPIGGDEAGTGSPTAGR